MTSLWHSTAPGILSDPFEEGARDAVVVGAGLTGLVTAVLLARAGLGVTVLEARRAGAVTTGNTTGKLSLLQGTVFSELRERAGDTVLAAYAEANREGQAWLLRELESWGVQTERRTAYTYASRPEQAALLDREREAARSVGVAVEETAATGLPFETFGAISLEQQAQIHPMVVLARLALELRERGGRLVERCRVQEVEVEDERVRITSPRGTLTAGLCVVATGTPILDRGMFFARLEPSRSFVAAYRLLRAAAPRGMYLSAGEPSRSLRTAQDGAGNELLVVGGEADIVGRPSDTRAVVGRLDSWVDDRFGASIRESWWAAQDYRTHSRVPFVGALPRGGGKIYTATGYNKWGMTNAVAAGLTIAAEVLGGNLEWARALRQHSLGLLGVRDALGANAEVAGRLVSGWARAEARSADATRDPEEGEGVVASDGFSPVGISRVDGAVCRVSAVCTHLGGVLRWNGAERSWDCPLHGSRFAADGRVLEGPAVRDLSARPDSGDGRAEVSDLP